MKNDPNAKYPSRWLVFSSCLLLMIFNGATYSFGLISDSIKDRCDFSQSQIDLIGTIGNIGNYSGLIPGIFNNRYGPQKTVWIGTLLTWLGWLGITICTIGVFDGSLFKSQPFIAFCFLFSSSRPSPPPSPFPPRFPFSDRVPPFSGSVSPFFGQLSPLRKSTVRLKKQVQPSASPLFLHRKLRIPAKQRGTITSPNYVIKGA